MLRRTWVDPEAYDRAAARLAAMFRRNIERSAADTDPGALAAGPVADGAAPLPSGDRVR